MNNKVSWKFVMIIGAIILSVIIMFVVAFNSVPNKAIYYDEQVTTAQSEIKVQEKRRIDLIPNLVDCVKAYDKYEYNTLIKVVKSRSVNNDSKIEEITTQIKAVAEAYPELKSSENYKELMNELSTTENKIAQSRSNYNKCVTRYNAYIKKFPNKQILGVIGYETLEYNKLDYNVSDDAPTDLFD